MEDQTEIIDTIIRQYPIGNGLDNFRASFNATCKTNDATNLSKLEMLDETAIKNLTSALLFPLTMLSAASSLPSRHSSRALVSDIYDVLGESNHGRIDVEHVRSLFRAVLLRRSDKDIWDAVYEVTTKRTAPPPILQDSKSKTAIHNRSNYVQSANNRTSVENEIFRSIDTLWYDVDIYGVFFQTVDEVAGQLFEKLASSPESLYDHENNAWKNWPTDTSEKEVALWLLETTNHIVKIAETLPSQLTIRQKLVKPPNHLLGSPKLYQPDFAFVDVSNDQLTHWRQPLALLELKKSSQEDRTRAWLQIARYALQVFGAQYSRRFVLGATLCSSTMRIWSFDRSGMLGSKAFDVNKDPRKFVSIIVGFLTMDHTLLGVDPTILSAGSARFVSDSGTFDAVIDGQSRRIVLDGHIFKSKHISGRGTACWRAHYSQPESSPRATEPTAPFASESTTQPATPLTAQSTSPSVINVAVKDYWPVPDRNEDVLLRMAQEKGVANMPRVLYTYTVQVNDQDDEILSNIRKDLNVNTGIYARAFDPQNRILDSSGVLSTSSKNPSGTSRKRSAASIGAGESLRKRHCSQSGAMSPMSRIHKRVILGDIGTPFADESDMVVLLESMAQCIGAHKSLLDAGILHRDISTGNLMVNEDRSDPSRLGLLIDLDHAVEIDRPVESGIIARTGTFLFMSVGILRGVRGSNHSFMDDLESFFWVLFWICAGYKRPNKAGSRLLKSLAGNHEPSAIGAFRQVFVSDMDEFTKSVDECFLPRYKCLKGCIVELCGAVFPNRIPWKEADVGLYARMQGILRRHKEYLEVERERATMATETQDGGEAVQEVGGGGGNANGNQDENENGSRDGNENGSRDGNENGSRDGNDNGSRDGNENGNENGHQDANSGTQSRQPELAV